MDLTLVKLKAEAYDLYKELEESQQKVNDYTKQIIVPLRDKLIEVNNSINQIANGTKEVGGSNNATQDKSTEDNELAQEV